MNYVIGKSISYLLISGMAIGLSACGGSGGGSSAPAEPQPVDPKPSPVDPTPVEKNTAPVASKISVQLSSNGPWVGTEVNASYVYQDGQGDKEGVTTFRWLRDGSPIANATNSKYTLIAEDSGKSIAVEVTPVALTGIKQGEAAQSAVITVVENAAPVAAIADINIPAEGVFVGLNLEAVFRYSDEEEDAAGEHKYQWLRDGNVIEGANGRTYTMVTEDAGKSITASITPIAVTGQSPGQTVTTRAAIPEINLAPVATNVAIHLGWSAGNGDVAYTAPKYGVKINGQYDYFDQDGDVQGQTKYRWLRDGVVIEGAVGLFYTVQAADVGKSLTFEVTPMAADGLINGIAKTSEATSKAVLNFAPEARNVRLVFDGDKIKVGYQVALAYDFYDQDGDAEQGTVARILMDDATVFTDSNGNFTANESNIGSSLIAEVTPRANHGELSGEKVTTNALRIYPLDRHFFTATVPWGFSDDTAKVIGVTDGHSTSETKIVKELTPSQTLTDFYMHKVEFQTQPISISDDPLAPRWLSSTRDRLASIRLSDSGEEYITEYVEGDIASHTHQLVKEITPFNGKVFFSSVANGVGGTLSVTDGTADGTQVFMAFKDFTHFFSQPKNLISLGDKLFFTATTLEVNDAGDALTGSGRELWVTDGEFKTDGSSNAKLVKDIYPGIDDAHPSDLTKFDGALYFSARSGNDQALDLWKTDGTAEGTVSVPDVNDPAHLTIAGDRLFFMEGNDALSALKKGENTPVKMTGLPFSADKYVPVGKFIAFGSDLYLVADSELYHIAFDSNSAVKILPESSLGASARIGDLAVLNGELYLSGSIDLGNYKLLKLNASKQIELVAEDIINPDQLMTLNGRLLFSAADYYNRDTELWHSDGTEEGTKELKDLNYGNSSKPVLHLSR